MQMRRFVCPVFSFALLVILSVSCLWAQVASPLPPASRLLRLLLLMLLVLLALMLNVVERVVAVDFGYDFQ